MPDSGDVDAALSAKLLADGALAALTPDGVWFDAAKKGALKFVLISLINEDDEQMFGGRAFEDGLYLVKAVMQETSTANAKAAAARIDALLDGGTLTVAGYTLMRMQRMNRVRLTEVDETNADLRWQHRGGHYALQVST